MRKLAIALVLLVLLGGFPPAFCQLEDLPSEEEVPDTTRVRIGDTTAVPGETLTLPIYLTPAKGARVGSLQIEISFVSENLKFVRLDPGIVAESGNLQLQTDVKTGKDEENIERSTVMIAASVREGNSDPIGSGLLAYLILKTSEQARPANITLRASGTATELNTKKLLEKFEVLNARVDVYAPGDRPVVSCFFFTH
ncbi:MAG TPA: cohesin domain-containing protein [Chthonomonadales bacterium]|nr:cohesin domain-containing protein [Chthonomonadales bacterium]